MNSRNDLKTFWNIIKNPHPTELMVMMCVWGLMVITAAEALAARPWLDFICVWVCAAIVIWPFVYGWFFYDGY